ncbi:MAG: hypothetical protein PHP57_00960 [Sideroxydans sp.]|nr:hypothetical protein [Sideroxydans sp.]
MSQIGLFSVLCLFASTLSALGLGEIKVSSSLGERLKAQVELLDMEREDPQDVKIRLAPLLEYKKNELFYPAGLKFIFKVDHLPSGKTVLNINSNETVEDPFLNLLIEVSSSSTSGKVYKEFTLLLDPANQVDVSPVVVNAPQLPAVDLSKKADASSGLESLPLSSQVKKNILPPSQSIAEVLPTTQPVRRPPKKRIQGNTSSPDRVVRKNNSSGQLALTLSNALSLNREAANGGAGLSISRSDPNAPKGWSLMMGDSLQEDIIAKEKSISDMKSQIGEMEALVQNLKAKLAQTGMSGVGAPVLLSASQVPADAEMIVATSATLSASAVSPTPVASPQPDVAVGTEAVAWKKWLEVYWKKLVVIVALLVVGVAALFEYKRRQQLTAWNHGIFDDLDTPVAGATGPSALDRSMKVPLYKEKKVVPEAAAEYDLLEAADIYLRFDNDELAEESLRDALKINAKNPQTYLSLLGIYESRGDAKAFAETAEALKMLGDAEAWKKALELGKKFESA